MNKYIQYQLGFLLLMGVGYTLQIKALEEGGDPARQDLIEIRKTEKADTSYTPYLSTAFGLGALQCLDGLGALQGLYNQSFAYLPGKNLALYAAVPTYIALGCYSLYQEYRKKAPGKQKLGGELNQAGNAVTGLYNKFTPLGLVENFLREKGYFTYPAIGTEAMHLLDKNVIDIIPGETLLGSAAIPVAVSLSYLLYKKCLKVVKAVDHRLDKLEKEVGENMVGFRRIGKDLDKIAEDAPDGKAARAVIREVFSQGAGAVGAGIKKEAIDPTLEELSKKSKPMEKNVENLVEKIGGLAWTTLKVAGGITALYYGGRILYNYFSKQINMPRLDVILKKAPLSVMEQKSRFRPMIFKNATIERINDIFQSTLAIRQYIEAGTEGATYKNLLLHGPPGSGKRMFAEQLAVRNGMDFYEIPRTSWKFKDDDLLIKAVKQFFENDLLKSPNGAVVYIDDAQIFFSNGPVQDMVSSHRAHLIHCLVEQVQRRNNICMIVFGMSGRPSHSTDMGLIVDETIEISLPEKAERIRLLRTYRDLYFEENLSKEETAENVQTVLSEDVLGEIARKLNRAPARELAAFMKTAKIESDSPASTGLTSELIQKILERTEKKQASSLISK